MPVAPLPNGVRLYYEEYGDAAMPAVVLIPPAGADHRAWIFQTAEFAAHYRTIVFDNRAVGETEYPSATFGVADMAEDVCQLLDHLDVERTALVGAALGGCVAMELALTHPERVWALVLASTTCGGKLASRSHAERLAIVEAITALPPAERARQLARLYYGPRAWDTAPDAYGAIATRAGWDSDERIDLDRHPHNRAIASFDVSKRIGRLRGPTLVIHGDDDMLVPPADGGRLADAIRGARFHVVHGGHLCFMQSAGEFNRATLDFLAAVLQDAR